MTVAVESEPLSARERIADLIDTPREESVLRDLIQRLVCDVVQEEVDKGRSPREGGEIALQRLIGRRWDGAWMRLFGGSALATQWRALVVQPERERFYRATELISEAPEPVVERVQRTTETLVEPAPLLSSPEPRIRHGRDDSVSILSKDIEALLATNMRVVGIWVRAGELRRKDVVTLRDTMREHAKAVVAGYKLRRARLQRVAAYFEDDVSDLRGLVVSGRISHEELRAFLDAVQ